MSALNSQQLKELEEILGFPPEGEIFETAFTHKSFVSTSNCSNERLEFLGDSVLNYYITLRLYSLFPEASEGSLTRMRSHLVNTKRLAQIAKNLRLDRFLKTSASIEKSSISVRRTLMADTVESLIGAIFVTGGLEKVSSFIEKYFDIKSASDAFDEKSLLQQLVQKEFATLPQYRVVKEIGEPHKKTFTVEVFINGKCIGRGTGPNKKIAENEAASFAWKKLKWPNQL